MRKALGLLLSLVGAVLGGALGAVFFRKMLDYGLYALILPGPMLGMGCMLASPSRSAARGIACAVAGLGLGLVMEWWVAPMKADPSLIYFLAHIPQLTPPTFLLLGLGTLFAGWWGRDRSPFEVVRRLDAPARVEVQR